MIDASMYTINNFSPADFIGAAPDAGLPPAGFSSTGGPYGSGAAPGKSFREYLASLTSASEIYTNRQELEKRTLDSEYYEGSVGDRMEAGTQSAREEEKSAARTAGQDAAEQPARETADNAAPEEKLRTDGNQNSDEKAEERSRTVSGEDSKQNAGADDAASSEEADTDRHGEDLKTAANGSEGKKDGADAAEQEGRRTAGKIQQERSEQVRRGEEETAADLDKKSRSDDTAAESAAAAQAVKAGAAAAAGIFEQNSRRMKEQTEGEGLNGEGKAADGRRIKGAGPQRTGNGVARDESDQRPKITIVDSRRKTGRAGEKTGEGQVEGVSERTGRSAGKDGSAGRTQPTEFRLISSQSSSSSPGSQTDQNGSPQQALQVLVRSEGSDTLQVPLSKSDNGGDLQNQLARQLREQLNSEIVKRGSIMVRNNGSGEIRLELKPDHLGQVKILLSLENNNIAGRILVENISVKEAFDQNMQELYRAFKEHGFGETALNVSVGNQQRQKNAHKDANGPAGGVSGTASLQAMETEQSRTLQPTGEQRLVDVLA